MTVPDSHPDRLRTSTGAGKLVYMTSTLLHNPAALIPSWFAGSCLVLATFYRIGGWHWHTATAEGAE